jgi:hypothetical protein
MAARPPRATPGPPLGRHLSAIADALARVADEGTTAIELAVLDAGLFPHTPEQRAAAPLLLRPFCGLPHSLGVSSPPRRLAACLRFVLGLGLGSTLVWAQLGAGPGGGGDFVFFHHVLECRRGDGGRVRGYLADACAPSTLWRGRGGGDPTPYDGVLRAYLQRRGDACTFVQGGARELAERLAGDRVTPTLLVIRPGATDALAFALPLDAWRRLCKGVRTIVVCNIDGSGPGSARGLWSDAIRDPAYRAHEFRDGPGLGSTIGGSLGVLVARGSHAA